MPTFPPAVEWPKFDDTKMKYLADGVRAAMVQGSDFLTTGAAYLHPQIVSALKRYGLDGSNRFGFGSDANKAATRVTDQFKHAAECMVDAGSHMGFAYSIFMKDVWEPIQRAKAEQESGQTQTLNV